MKMAGRVLAQSLYRFTSACFSQIRNASVLTKEFFPSGCIAAPFTPFKSNGDIDVEKFPKYFEHMKQFGVPSVFANGTTGEGLSMTVSERKSVAEAWMKGKPGLKYVIVHIGAGNLRDSQELAVHSESIGVDAIACISPSYYKPQTEEALLEYMKAVAGAAPNTPFYLYDINFMTNVYLNLPRFLKLANSQIPTLVGIKHSSPELNSLMRCHKYNDEKYQILLGSDDTLLPALSLGVSASVPSSFMSPLQNKIREAYFADDKDAAELAQYRCMQVSAARAKYGSGSSLFSVSRAIMAMIGLDLGPPRLPLTPLNESDYKALKKDLANIGFFNWLP